MTVLALSELTLEQRSQFAARDRANAEKEAFVAGRLGATRVPDGALFPGGLDPSTTATLAIIDAFMAGQLERRK